MIAYSFTICINDFNGNDDSDNFDGSGDGGNNNSERDFDQNEESSESYMMQFHLEDCYEDHSFCSM